MPDLNKKIIEFREKFPEGEYMDIWGDSIEEFLLQALKEAFDEGVKSTRMVGYHDVAEYYKDDADLKKEEEK